MADLNTNASDAETGTKNAAQEELENVLKAMVDACNAERQKTEPYKEMFRAGSSYTRLLRRVHHEVMGHALDASDVINQRQPGTIPPAKSNDVLEFMLAAPFLAHKLKAHIKKTEGHACCVDKTFFLLSQQLKTILNSP